MDLEEVLRRRRMTRRFEPDPLPTATLERVLASLSRLPSAGFSQGVDAVVLTTPRARERFWQAASEPSWRASDAAAGLLAAPVIVVPVADPDAYLARYAEADKAGSGLSGRPASAWEVPYWLVDASFAVLALLLAAESEGLGGLFFRLHRPKEEVLAALGVPRQHEVVGAVALGRRQSTDRPSGSPTRRKRRRLDEIIHREGW
jgi:nitroreductase